MKLKEIETLHKHYFNLCMKEYSEKCRKPKQKSSVFSQIFQHSKVNMFDDEDYDEKRSALYKKYCKKVDILMFENHNIVIKNFGYILEDVVYIRPGWCKFWIDSSSIKKEENAVPINYENKSIKSYLSLYLGDINKKVDIELTPMQFVSLSSSGYWLKMDKMYFNQLEKIIFQKG